MKRTDRMAARDVETVRWNPPRPYALALEVMRVSELCKRGSPEHFRRPQRIEFFMLMAVTEGATDHIIDFSSIAAGVGTWLLLRPGQMQRFDFSQAWEGLVVVFRPDFLPPGERRQRSPFHVLAGHLNDLPSVIRLSPGDHAVCLPIAERMKSDAGMDASEQDRNALMLYQVCTLLTRLKLKHRRDEPLDPAAGVDRERVTRLRNLVDEHFRSQHRALWYASRLGCTMKTLSRAALAVTGKTAKALILERIALEAKRQLVHSEQPVQRIADELGFDEPSNFVKFFRREVGRTPKVFREQQRAS